MGTIVCFVLFNPPAQVAFADGQLIAFKLLMLVKYKPLAKSAKPALKHHISLYSVYSVTVAAFIFSHISAKNSSSSSYFNY